MAPAMCSYVSRSSHFWDNLASVPHGPVFADPSTGTMLPRNRFSCLRWAAYDVTTHLTSRPPNLTYNWFIAVKWGVKTKMLVVYYQHITCRLSVLKQLASKIPDTWVFPKSSPWDIEVPDTCGNRVTIQSSEIISARFWSVELQYISRVC